MVSKLLPGEVADSLPDLCSSQVLLVLLLLSLGLALLVVLSGAEPFTRFWLSLGLTALYTVWVTLIGAATLCGLNRANLLSTKHRYLFVFCIIQMIVLVASGVVVFLGDHFSYSELSRTGEVEIFVARNQLIALVASFAFIRYLILHQRWKAQVEAEAQARMDSLQARIRPHFLFNTLNTIASLVRTRPDEAEQAVLDLSDLLRSGLRTNAEHTLAEELELVRGYLRIESQRLGERLAIDWRVEDSLPLDQTIPALLVQPLVENAVVHGISKLPDGGCLRISARATRGKRWCVRVENPWPGPDASEQGEGNRMALDNIRQRLELAYGERASLKIDSTGERFSA
ncbi:MAG: histidine kinase, partial [Pirellulaceae bacterium]